MCSFMAESRTTGPRSVKSLLLVSVCVCIDRQVEIEQIEGFESKGLAWNMFLVSSHLSGTDCLAV